MAEILVRVVDKVNEDYYLNCGCTKRGDVIVVAPDGWKWGVEERANPEWRILSLPQYSVEDLQAFLAPEKETDPSNPSRTLQKRGFKFDVDHPDLPQEISDCIADDTRASDTYADKGAGDATVVDVSPTAGQPKGIDAPTAAPAFDVFAFKVQKPSMDDPAVIG